MLPLKGELAQKRAHDSARRASDRARVGELDARCEQLREQLYELRWGQQQQQQQQKHDLKSALRSLRAELRAAEAALHQARADAAEAFDQMLALETLGISLAEMPSADRAAAGVVESELAAIAHAKAQADQNDVTNLKMMRVASKEVTKEMAPGDKWAYLYGSYESSKKTESANPSGMRKSKSSSISQAEVTKLRGEIYALKQKTTLSQQDKVRLAELQAMLKAATGHE